LKGGVGTAREEIKLTTGVLKDHLTWKNLWWGKLKAILTRKAVNVQSKRKRGRQRISRRGEGNPKK